MIRNLLLSSVALATISGSALAADLPSRLPPPMLPPPPIWSWTGFYVGINGGYGGDKFSYALPGGGAFGTSPSITSSGFFGGGQVGYNWQFPASQWLIGAEADFQGSAIRGELSTTTPAGTFGIGTKLDWFGTARGRVGYSCSQFLPYVTVGFAYGQVRDYAYTPAASFSTPGYTHTGYTVGAGLEYAITHNLTFKTEYLYIDLGRSAYADGFVAGATDSVRTTAHLVRAGLNYKFDFFAPPAPIVAKY